MCFVVHYLDQHRQISRQLHEGGRFQSFSINDLELVDLTGIEPVTS